MTQAPIYQEPPVNTNKFKAPGIALVVVGIVHILWGCYNFMNSLITDTQAQIAQLERTNAPAFAIEIIKSGPLVSIIAALLFAVIGLLTVFAGTQMMKTRRRGLVITMCVIQCIPCIGAACCFLGIPFGIWGLVVLFSADAKKAFVS